MKMNSYSCCSSAPTNSHYISKLSSVLQLVSEVNKLQILCILKKKKHCVCELLNHMQISQSLLSHHLKSLKDIGIVEYEKRGLRVYYSLTNEGKYITRLLFSMYKKEEQI